MSKTQRLIVPLRIALVLAVAFTLVMMTLSVPGEFAETITKHPESARLSWPVLVLVELELAGFLVLILCTWQLLTMIKRDRIFSEDSSLWVNLIVRTMFAGWVLFAVVAAYLVASIYFTPELRDPGIPVLLFGILLVGAVLVMLVVIMRTLLRQATTLRTDLDEVI